jgi:drug/metabolite transporter (DMT)-like permease
MTNAVSRRSPASSLAILAGLVTLYFVWGSTYIGIKIAVESMPAFVMASGRFLLAGLLLLGWCVFREGTVVLRISRVELRDSFVVGALLLGGGMGMVALAEQTIPSGITALLIALMPVWVAVLGRIVFGERLPRIVVVGIVVGLVGVLILVAPTGGSLALDAGGLAAVLISPICWASGSLYSSHRASLPRLPLVATAIQMLCGGVVLAVMALVSGEFSGFSLGAVTTASWLGFLYLVTIGSGIGYTTYVWLLRVAPLPKVATYAYVNPVVAFVLSAIFLGEDLSGRTVVAATVIVAAVALIVTARSRPGAEPGVDPVGLAEAGEPALARSSVPVRSSGPVSASLSSSPSEQGRIGDPGIGALREPSADPMLGPSLEPR